MIIPTYILFCFSDADCWLVCVCVSQIMAVAPGSQRYVSEGTRVCAYWSQQFRCLYPGTVAKSRSRVAVLSTNDRLLFSQGMTGWLVCWLTELVTG